MPSKEIYAPATSNGAFIGGIEPGARWQADRRLVQAIIAAEHEFFPPDKTSGLAETLAYIKRAGITQLRDFFGSTALEGFWDNIAVTDGYNDTTTQMPGSSPPKPGSRSLTDYLERTRWGLLGLRPVSITEAQQPVMALVALDPSKIDLTDEARGQLLQEVGALFEDCIQIGKPSTVAMSDTLRSVLSATLLGNTTYVEELDEAGNAKPWPLPFDKIASLKALQVLLSGSDHSGQLRQGAIRLIDADKTQIIVGASGLHSMLDETVAKAYGTSVLEAYKAVSHARSANTYITSA